MTRNIQSYNQYIVNKAAIDVMTCYLAIDSVK